MRKLLSKIKNMKKQIIIGVSLLVFGTLKAQYTKQYVHFDVGGGLHNLEYNLQNGTQKGQLGYTADVAYSYFFKPSWGIKTGIGVQAYGAQSTLNFLSATPAVDTDGDTYEFRTNYKNWQEEQHALFVEVPLELQFRHFFSKKVGLLASVGAKVSIPVLASYKTSGGSMVTTGYYSKWNVELYKMPQHGFTTLTNAYSGNLSLKTAYSGIADLGCLYTLSKEMSLYMGAYVNYGLNNILTPDTKQIYQADGVYNGVFASNQLTKLNPFAVGVKVGVCWKLKDIIKIRKNKFEAAHQNEDSGPTIYTGKKKSSEPENNYGSSESVNDQLSAKPVSEKKSSETVVVSQESVNSATNQTINEKKSSETIVVNQESLNAVNDKSSLKSINEKKSSTPINSESSPKFMNIRHLLNSDASQNRTKSLSESGTTDDKASPTKTFVGNTFEAGKCQISESNNVLDQIISVLKANPTFFVVVQGHASSEGNPQWNQKLSELRALAVCDYLINHGIDEKRLSAVGYGDTMPIASNETEKGRIANRRVDFVIRFQETIFK